MSVFGGAALPDMSAVGWRSQSWIGTAGGPGLAGVALVADQIFASPFIVRRPVQIDTLGVNVTAGVAGTAILGVYSNLSGGIGPDRLIATCSAAVDIGSVALVTAGFTSNPILPAPLVWFAILPSSAASVSVHQVNNADALYFTDLIGGEASSWKTSSAAGGRVHRAQRAQAFGSGLPAEFGAITWTAGATTPHFTARVA